MTDEIGSAIDDARIVLDALLMKHRAAAIPAIIGTCVFWAFEHGGASVMRGSLTNAIKLLADLRRTQRSMRPTPKPGGRQRGGLARAASLSPERRREIARAAAKARWSQQA
jgi:hypothetical protein